MSNFIHIEYVVIYKIVNKVNGKVYIGQTIKSVKERFDSHRRASRRLPYPLYKAFRKYGLENFEVEEITTARSLKKLDEKERYWIKFYKANNSSYGYNCSKGGSKPFGRQTGILPLAEVQRRLEIRFGDMVTIKKNSYKSVSSKAIFIDKEYGEWSAIVGNVLSQATGHPKRAREKAIQAVSYTAEEINNRLESMGSPSRLVENSYRGMLSKAKFIDKDFGDFFSYPVNVVHKGTGHIKRAVLRREATKLEKGRCNAKKCNTTNR